MFHRNLRYLTTIADIPNDQTVTTRAAKIFHPRSVPSPFRNIPLVAGSFVLAKNPVAIMAHNPAPQWTPTQPTGSSTSNLSSNLITATQRCGTLKKSLVFLTTSGFYVLNFEIRSHFYISMKEKNHRPLGKIR